MIYHYTMLKLAVYGILRYFVSDIHGHHLWALTFWQSTEKNLTKMLVLLIQHSSLLCNIVLTFCNTIISSSFLLDCLVSETRNFLRLIKCVVCLWHKRGRYFGKQTAIHIQNEGQNGITRHIVKDMYMCTFRYFWYNKWFSIETQWDNSLALYCIIWSWC